MTSMVLARMGRGVDVWFRQRSRIGIAIVTTTLIVSGLAHSGDSQQHINSQKVEERAAGNWFFNQWSRPRSEPRSVFSAAKNLEEATILPALQSESTKAVTPTTRPVTRQRRSENPTVVQVEVPTEEPISQEGSEVGVAVQAIQSEVPAEPAGPGEYMGKFSVTCYALQGNTASGEAVHDRGVAVDRRMFPFGTQLYIEGVGWRIANDTGGSVRGNRLDIWLPNVEDCIAFGRRTLDVYRA